jgi:hypothetical protein
MVLRENKNGANQGQPDYAQYSIALRPHQADHARSFNVLKGINRGNILVDDLTNPTRAVVREATSGTLYFGGWLDAPLLESQVLHFRQSGEVGIGCWLDDPLNFVKDRWINNDGSKN